MKQQGSSSVFIDWKLWGGLFISALFIYLAFRKVDLAELWLVTKSADPALLLLVIFATIFQYVVRAWRWGLLLEPINPCRFINRLTTILIGFAANCVLPARLGEFIRANYLGHTEKISGSSAFGTIVVERLFDGLTLLIVLFIGIMGTTFQGEWEPLNEKLHNAGYMLLLMYIGVIVFLVGFKYRPQIFISILERLLFFLPEKFRKKITDMLWNFSLGLVLLKSPAKWFLVIFYSFLVWAIHLVQIQWLQQALGLSLPFISTFLIMAMASLGVMIPSAPGYVGTFHLSVLYAFLLYGVGREEALSAAILWHAALFMTTLIIGFIAFVYVLIHFGRPSETRTIQPNAPAEGENASRAQVGDHK
jgi:uncharacterized protein (TIRG00374 family)